MSVILPLIPSVANYEFITTLNGTQYVINVRWNSRDLAWYMSLSGTDEDPIVSNMKLVLGTIIGARVADERMPGVFIVRDTSNALIDAGFDDIGEGQRVQVYFFTYDELFEQIAAEAPINVPFMIDITGGATKTLGALTLVGAGDANVQT